jgi:hypothetical protein
MTEDYRVYTVRRSDRYNMKEGAQLDLAVMLGQIDGKLDRLIAQDLDKRLGRVESWKSRLHGGGAVILSAITLWEFLRYVKILH